MRRGNGGNFHVGIIDAQSRGVFANAVALKGVGDHHDGRLHGDATIGATEHERLRAAARFPRAGQASLVRLGQRFQKIKGANAVPGL